MVIMPVKGGVGPISDILDDVENYFSDQGTRVRLQTKFWKLIDSSRVTADGMEVLILVWQDKKPIAIVQDVHGKLTPMFNVHDRVKAVEHLIKIRLLKKVELTGQKGRDSWGVELTRAGERVAKDGANLVTKGFAGKWNAARDEFMKTKWQGGTTPAAFPKDAPMKNTEMSKFHRENSKLRHLDETEEHSGFGGKTAEGLLRKKLIRLAYASPALRGHLLSLLKQSSERSRLSFEDWVKALQPPAIPYVSQVPKDKEVELTYRKEKDILFGLNSLLTQIGDGWITSTLALYYQGDSESFQMVNNTPYRKKLSHQLKAYPQYFTKAWLASVDAWAKRSAPKLP
jgi:hypothetical protein